MECDHSGDTSRRKFQNVVTDSCVVFRSAKERKCSAFAERKATIKNRPIPILLASTILHAQEEEPIQHPACIDSISKHDRRTCAQGENAFPAYSLMRWVLGVLPVKPGMKEVILSYYLCGLSEMKDAVPRPRGVIQVAWSKGEKGISLEVEVPEGMDVKVDLTSENISWKERMSLDGQELAIERQGKRSSDVPAGKHILTFY